MALVRSCWPFLLGSKVNVRQQRSRACIRPYSVHNVLDSFSSHSHYTIAAALPESNKSAIVPTDETMKLNDDRKN